MMNDTIESSISRVWEYRYTHCARPAAPESDADYWRPTQGFPRHGGISLGFPLSPLQGCGIMGGIRKQFVGVAQFRSFDVQRSAFDVLCRKHRPFVMRSNDPAQSVSLSATKWGRGPGRGGA